MQENPTNSEEFTFSFTVAPFFFENFTSYPILKAERIQNNRFLSQFFKVSQLKSLEKLYSDPKISFKSRSSSQISPEKRPKLHEIYEKFAKNRDFSQFYEVLLNEKAIDLNPESKKCVISADLASFRDFRENSLVLLLNEDWVREKKLEKARIYRENLEKNLRNPEFKRILKEISNEYADFRKKFDVKLSFEGFSAEKRAKTLRKRMKLANNL